MEVLEQKKLNSFNDNDRYDTEALSDGASAPRFDLFRAVEAPIAVLDFQGEVVFRNPQIERLMAALSKSGRCDFFWDFYSAQEKCDLMARVYNHLAQGQSVCEHEFRLTGTDGHPRYLDCRFTPLKDDPDFPGALVCTVKDNTEMKQLQEFSSRNEKQLEENRAVLRRKEIALAEVLSAVDQEKQQVARDCQSNIDRVALPILRMLKEQVSDGQRQYLDLLESCISDITRPFISRIEAYHSKLSPREIEICNMINEGMTSKQIATLLCTAVNTVRVQRKMIRKKLGISGTKANLRSRLQNFHHDRTDSSLQS